MRVGNASVVISPGREVESGHVEMNHGDRYAVRLSNHYHRPAECALSVDGKEVGCFLVGAHGSVTIERPVNDRGCFTFYLRDSSSGQQAGLGSVGKDSMGLVEARFRFEKAPVRPVPTVTRTAEAIIEDAAYNAGELTARGIEPQSCAFAGEDKLYFGGKARHVKTSSFVPGGTGLSGQSNQSFYTVPNLDIDPSLDTTITLRLVGAGVRYSEPRELRPLKRSNSVPAPVTGALE